MENLITGAAQNGIWALLFVSFFVYQLKQNEKREQQANDREKVLMEYLNHKNETDQKIAVTLEEISEEIQKMNMRVCNLEAKKVSK